MDESGPRPRGGSDKGCGCQAALAVLILVGIPVLLVFSFGLAPCKDGPCDPNGGRNLAVAAAAVAALAALAGVSVGALLRWATRRGGEGARRKVVLAFAALAFAAGLGLAGLILL